MPGKSYRGRFAPSPTGPLHFGSLVAAVGSYLQARSNRGEWWLRIEDIDPPREVAGASNQIINSLEQFGFEWDGPVSYQHERLPHYAEILNQLAKTGRVYGCTCSRKKILRENKNRTDAHAYPGTCRANTWPAETPSLVKKTAKTALRLDTRGAHICFDDAIQGEQDSWLAQHGDYIVRRSDGLYAYQLAVAIDDAEQGFTEVVRGADLLPSTAQQLYLQQLLSLTSPTYAHLPVVHDPETGHKLSKQSAAPAISEKESVNLLWYALCFLGQQPEPALKNSDLEDFWNWSIANWRFKLVPKTADMDKNILKYVNV